MRPKFSPFSVILVFVCFTLIGLALIRFLPVKLSPGQTLPRLHVGFNMQGYPARVIEMEVTSKLEGMLCRIKGIENISSTSGNGWGNISIRFDKHVNIDAVRFEASTIIRQLWPNLPQGLSYPTISQSRSDNNAARPFLTYTLNAPSNPADIQYFAEEYIKPKLAQIAGVDRIRVSGAMPMEWRLEYDSKQLETLNISVNTIRSAISSYLSREFFGIATVGDDPENPQWTRIALVADGAGQDRLDPARIEVQNIDGKVIFLDQLVSVIRREQEAGSYFRINGLNSIYLSVTAEENANQLDLSRKIKEKMGEIRLLFPPNYEMHTSYDATEYIIKELDKIYFRSGLTLIILLLFVLLIYRSVRYLLLIFLSLAMNIGIAVLFYYLAGLEMQLYSLAGITISLTLVIDNTIVMSDQIIRRHNMKAYLAILTATITTIASLSIIFFMDEQIRLNLQDFAWVVIINLAVSLFVALFLVPALIEKLGMVREKGGEKREERGRKRVRILGRINLIFNRFYADFCCLLWRWKVPACIVLILSFGLPVFLLPDKLESSGKWAGIYNKTIGSAFYKEKVKPHADIFLGGTLRLFSKKVFEGSYMTQREETTVQVTATLPNGSTVSQMNDLIRKMEVYIGQFKEVKQFQTTINSARRAAIRISFTPEGEESGFPLILKNKLIGRATELGGGSWGVYGLGDSFNNSVQEMAGSFQVILRGFNYDELWEWAERFKSKLMTHRRIREVTIGSEFSQYKDDYREFIFSLDYEQMARRGVTPQQLFSTLQMVYGREIPAGQIGGVYGAEQIVLASRQSQEYDVWSLSHIPERAGREKEYKLSEVSHVEKRQSPQNVVKEDQQYRLCLQFEYVGAGLQGEKVLNRYIDEAQKVLPMGYTVERHNRYWSWGRDNSRQYLLLLLIFVIVYFMCSILFNSLRQPLAVIFVIPIAFIGIFLTFYLFRLNFDQGGFASFILLCGIAVNANIYILNEYNNIRKEREGISPLRAYIKAWNAKIGPIFLTVISTILGFIPFMIGSRESFWFPLAAGTIGGLIMSLIGTFLFLPLFMGVAKPLPGRRKCGKQTPERTDTELS